MNTGPGISLGDVTYILADTLSHTLRGVSYAITVRYVTIVGVYAIGHRIE